MNWIIKFFRASNEKHRWRKKEIRENTLTWYAVKNSLSSLTGSSDKPENTKIMKRDNLPVEEPRWIFKVLSGIDQGREYIALTKEIRVGRHPENLILLRDPKASRFHAIIYHKGPRLVLEDLGSTNGTRVNGEIVMKKRTLFSGDLIKIGETLIRVNMEKG